MALDPKDLQHIRTIVREEIDIHRKETKKGFKRLEKKLDKSFDYLDKQHISLINGPSAYKQKSVFRFPPCNSSYTAL